MSEHFDDLMGEAASRKWGSLDELNEYLASRTHDFIKKAVRSPSADGKRW